MITIRNEMNCEALRLEALWAYGTAEGARKAWDARGRGKKARETPTKPSIQKSGVKLVKKYASLGQTIGMLAVKLEDSRKVRNVAAKTLHFLRALGDYIEPYKNLTDVVAKAGIAVWGVVHEVNAHTASIHGVLTWAMSHVAPVVHHVSVIAGLN